MTPSGIKAQYDADDSKIFCFDASYALPSKEWVLDDFSHYFRVFLNRMGLEKWDEQFDCDDFSRLSFGLAIIAQALAGIAHAKTRKRKEQGLAFGVFNFMLNEKTGHSINTFITKKDGVLFWEPQTQALTTLSESEKKSASFILF